MLLSWSSFFTESLASVQGTSTMSLIGNRDVSLARTRCWPNEPPKCLGLEPKKHNPVRNRTNWVSPNGLGRLGLKYSLLSIFLLMTVFACLKYIL